MGNKPSNVKQEQGKEMLDSVTYIKTDSSQEPLPELEELAKDCWQLQEMVDDLEEAIDDIFEERDDPNESIAAMESRLQTMTRNNQLQVHRLHKFLERHSKIVGVRDNAQVMRLVRELVSKVNSYMNMLMKNIRKLRQRLYEIQLTEQANRPKPKNLKTHIDVIPELMDVDAMLCQLSDTEMAREELERDIICVLVFWRDFKELFEDTADTIDQKIKVKEAAESVSHGLAQLNATKEK